MGKIKKLCIVLGVFGLVLILKNPNTVFATEVTLQDEQQVTTEDNTNTVGDAQAVLPGVKSLTIDGVEIVKQQSDGTSVFTGNQLPDMHYEPSMNNLNFNDKQLNVTNGPAISYVGDIALKITGNGSITMSTPGDAIDVAPATTASASTQLLYLNKVKLSIHLNDPSATAISTYGLYAEESTLSIDQSFQTAIANQVAPIKFDISEIYITNHNVSDNVKNITSLNAGIELNCRTILNITMPSDAYNKNTYGIFTQHVIASSKCRVYESQLYVNNCKYGIFLDDELQPGNDVPSWSNYFYQGMAPDNINYYLRAETIFSMQNPFQTASQTVQYTKAPCIAYTNSTTPEGFCNDVNDQTNINGLYVVQNTSNDYSMGVVYNTTGQKNHLLFRLICLNTSQPNATWQEISSWQQGEWFDWKPQTNGRYAIIGEVRNELGTLFSTNTVFMQIDTKVKNTCAVWENADTVLFGTCADRALPGAYVVMELYNIERQGWEYGSGKLPAYEDGDFYGNWWRLKNPEKGNYWGYFRVYSKDGMLLDSQNYWLTVDH